MTGAGTPVSKAAFAAAMARLGPFESSPRVAVAWSGGGDSTALLDLVREWAQGRVRALHVDHGLRANSADEARLLASRAARAGIEFECLPWRGAKPATGIMDAARIARADLLEAACAAAGIWHLLLGHHADDQRETSAMRAARGSGPDGLAGMSAIVERTRVRLVRPLLGFAHADLLATCRARGLDWIEDPSNRDPRFARAALRNAGGPPDVPVGEHAAARIARERDLAGLLARAVALDAAGFARVGMAELAAAPFDLASAALARIVLTVGGGEYAPRSARVEGALAKLLGAAPRAGTLGHCRLVPGRDGRLVVARETAGIAPPVGLVDGAAILWDGRFEAKLARSRSGLTLGALGSAGWAELPRETRQAATIPPAARASLPAIRDLDGVVSVPHLFYGRMRYPLDTVEIRFRPRHALAGPPFAEGS